MSMSRLINLSKDTTDEFMQSVSVVSMLAYGLAHATDRMTQLASTRTTLEAEVIAMTQKGQYGYHLAEYALSVPFSSLSKEQIEAADKALATNATGLAQCA